MSARDEESPLEAGQELAGRYRIIRRLGKGGMGAVYEAKHIALGRTVAVKVLLRELTREAEAVARFMQEARAAAAIGHPGIVEVFDLGEDGGLTFLAMELLKGEELTSRLKGGQQLPVGDVARIGADLADAVAAAHEHGIIHRDLKPQNIFLARAGRRYDIVKVLDFGLAKLAVQDRVDIPETRSGMIFGTPLYMSPEQLLSSKGLDGRSDTYTIGAILYEALAGQAPYKAETYGELVLTVSNEDPAPLASLRPDAPERLVRVIERAMAREKGDRYQSARELADALEDEAIALGAVTTTTSGKRRITDPSALTESQGDKPPSVDLDGGASPSERGSAPATPLGETPFATSSEPHPRRPEERRWPLIAGVAGAVVLAALVLVLGVRGLPPQGEESLGGGLRGGEPVADARAEAEGSTTPGTLRSDAVAEAPGEDGGSGGRDAAEAPPPPTKVEVEIVTVPPGAAVKVGDERHCTSPCKALLDDETVVVSARLSGYREASRRLESPLPPRLELRLRKRPPSPPIDRTVDPPPLLPR